MKAYIAPERELILFDAGDVIITFTGDTGTPEVTNG